MVISTVLHFFRQYHILSMASMILVRVIPTFLVKHFNTLCVQRFRRFTPFLSSWLVFQRLLPICHHHRILCSVCIAVQGCLQMLAVLQVFVHCFSLAVPFVGRVDCLWVPRIRWRFRKPDCWGSICSLCQSHLQCLLIIAFTSLFSALLIRLSSGSLVSYVLFFWLVCFLRGMLFDYLWQISSCIELGFCRFLWPLFRLVDVFESLPEVAFICTLEFLPSPILCLHDYWEWSDYSSQGVCCFKVVQRDWTCESIRNLIQVERWQ